MFNFEKCKYTFIQEKVRNVKFDVDKINCLTWSGVEALQTTKLFFITTKHNRLGKIKFNKKVKKKKIQMQRFFVSTTYFFWTKFVNFEGP